MDENTRDLVSHLTGSATTGCAVCAEAFVDAAFSLRSPQKLCAFGKVLFDDGVRGGSLIAVGDHVSWESQAQGRSAHKTGVIAALVPSGKPAKEAAINAGLDLRSFRENLASSGMARNHDSFLVSVKKTGSQAKPDLYWPRAASLVKAYGK